VAAKAVSAVDTSDSDAASSTTVDHAIVSHTSPIGTPITTINNDAIEYNMPNCVDVSSRPCSQPSDAIEGASEHLVSVAAANVASFARELSMPRILHLSCGRATLPARRRTCAIEVSTTARHTWHRGHANRESWARTRTAGRR